MLIKQYLTETKLLKKNASSGINIVINFKYMGGAAGTCNRRSFLLCHLSLQHCQCTSFWTD